MDKQKMNKAKFSILFIHVKLLIYNKVLPLGKTTLMYRLVAYVDYLDYLCLVPTAMSSY